MFEQLGYMWNDVGFIRYPMFFSFIAVVGLALFSTATLFLGGERPDRHAKAWLDAILFWGGFGAISGVLGTIVGFIIASQALESAAYTNQTLMWGGIKVALLSSAIGILILGFAGLAWFVLQLRWRLLVAEDFEAVV